MAAADADTRMMPAFINDDQELDPAWVREHTGLACVSCVVDKDLSHDGKPPLTAALLRLQLEGVDEPLFMVLKQIREGAANQPLSRQLGLPREAIFYTEMTKEISDFDTAHTYYAYGNMETGVKAVLMAQLDAVDSACFFGPGESASGWPGNPNGWGKDLPAIAARAGSPPPPAADVAAATFQAIAKVHAKFWRSSAVLSCTWLRGASWVAGEGRDAWEASQGMARGMWEKTKESISAGNSITWDATVLETMHAAVAGISWEKQLERLNTEGPYTLVHGDFWPGNVMWMCGGDEQRRQQVALIDWEMAGIGSGPQDLGQYMISNMEPAARRECEERVVRAYYDELVRGGVSSDAFSWEACWHEYKIGGVERWLWFLCYFGSAGEQMKGWTQFFHDQIADFMKDHDLTHKDFVQPRP